VEAHERELPGVVSGPAILETDFDRYDLSVLVLGDCLDLAHCLISELLVYGLADIDAVRALSSN
jgi:hypothetical protein